MNQPIPQLEDQIMTVPEVARYLKISKAKIYYLLAKKEIPYLKIGRNVRVRKKDLIAWLEQRIERIQ